MHATYTPEITGWFELFIRQGLLELSFGPLAEAQENGIFRFDDLFEAVDRSDTAITEKLLDHAAGVKFDRFRIAMQMVQFLSCLLSRFSEEVFLELLTP